MKIVLTCNAGSSNFKLGVFDAATLKRLSRQQFVDFGAARQWLRGQPYQIVAISHRVVHGGREFTGPVKLTPEVIVALKKLIPLAPLHQPQAIAIIEGLMAEYADITHIACFDTAFHHTQDRLERLFALPQKYAEQGIERYGFHGISYQHIAEALPDIMGQKAGGKIVVAHLGGGSSLCAMEGLQSKATTMGFSTLEGLMMGTRCGSLDAGVPLYLMQQERMTAEAITAMLYQNSGLKGVSGISDNMEVLEKSGAPEAQEAIALYCRMAARHMGALIAVLGGLDALVFTGGIGEHSAQVRERITAYFGWLGFHIDPQKNRQHASCISGNESRVAAYIIRADEESVLALAGRQLTA